MNATNQHAHRDELIKAFSSIRVYQHPADGKRAANKPLLLLLALGYAQREQQRLLNFVEIEPKLIALLKDFGPARATYSASLPFWYLQNDSNGNLWCIEGVSNLITRKGKSEPSASTLRRQNTRGGLVPRIFDALIDHPSFICDVARVLLRLHFPETLHEDITDAVGLELELASLGKGMRDPRFRALVLDAYHHRCAICGFDARLGGKNVGIEAAHIRWVQMLGSNAIDNGIALCALHHKLFDAGALTIEASKGVYSVSFSAQLNGASDAVRKWLLGSHRAILDLLPLDPKRRPHPENLRWHHREVFKSPMLRLEL